MTLRPLALQLTLYTYKYRAHSSDVFLVFNVKFADGTVIVGVVSEDETKSHGCG